ncbi:hypothetical protein BUALT_Bualt15G0062800 [Buddleja alternifolia]|uniref:Uncharacterized protein n=1 Tax=Buddleja alternifolia TaxID=168488 RepID=A0AAV6WNM7_9LAMI|nr:hypothetical protein BUALT_Bualt15G0062800 [Buddleja alternifolia]
MRLNIPNYKPHLSHESGRKWSCNINVYSTNGVLKLFAHQHSTAQPCDQLIRTAPFWKLQTPLWDFDYIQSLNTTEYTRLGISYHFEEQIKQILNSIHVKKYCGKNDYEPEKRDLYSTALEFRLLRQHGFSVSQEVFDSFKNKNGDFKTSLCEDTKGLLQLYEASFMLTEGQTTLDQAREFSTILLHKNLNARNIDENLSLLVRHALELPLHWRVERPNVRWFINASERKPDMDDAVLELAKLDFNIVQAKHQQELKHVSRLVENYFWNIGVFAKPQYGYARTMVTKVNALITSIDDIFDVYGTLEELQLFNNAIQRWDIEAIEQLPNYMQVCYLALYNFINEMAYDVLQEKGLLIIPHLRKSDEMKRGDVPKSIQCYMNETGASREEAQEYV